MTIISGQTRLVGVMGWPVEHTMSPPMHNAAFAALGMNCCYVPLAVPPDKLPEAVSGLDALSFVGCNVTVPHKQGVRAYLADVSDDAQAVGAVNTLFRRDDEWVGGNSDILGFLKSLEEEGIDPANKRALVLGAGGAARGVVYALARAGAQVTLMNRTAARAESLGKEMAEHFPRGIEKALPLDATSLKRQAEGADLLINATSLGMWPETGRSPWPDHLAFPSHLAVFDLVYNPLRTRLIEQAEAAGAKAVGGLKMLVYQGAVSFSWWFDVMPPSDVMYQACRRRLTRR